MSRRQDWLVGQLPMGMLDDSFFVRFVSMFQEVATTLLEGTDNITNAVDVTVAPAEQVRWLGSWIGQHGIDSSLDEQLQRNLVRQASKTLAWRGTRQGLEQYLEVLTGGAVDVFDSGGIGREGSLGDRPPRVVVRVQSVGWMRPEEFVALVSDEIPANVLLELYLGERRLWPRQSSAAEDTAATGAIPEPGGDGDGEDEGR